MDHDLVVLIDQVAAQRRVEQLVDAELWRADKRARWLAMLHRLVCSMDWTTGLVCGATLAQLAEVGDCSTRTVSRLLAWAQDVDLLVVVEVGASKTFLGTDTNRAPAYVLVSTQPPPVISSSTDDDPQIVESAQLTGVVDESGDLPHSYMSSKPLPGDRRLDPTSETDTHWPAWRIPTTPEERSAAVTTLLDRIGLGHERVPIWRARALLHQWWAAGACIAGLLHAIDHHPDGTARGDALRGATDPLRVLGYRLRPWVGHLDALPPHLTGRHGDYQAAQAARIAKRIATAEFDRAQQTEQPARSLSTAAAREAARTALEVLLADQARRRRGSDHSTPRSTLPSAGPATQSA